MREKKLLLIVLLLCAASAQAAEEVRVALVIGNSGYDRAPLVNPLNDATDVADVLERTLDFNTTLVLDADQASMQHAIRDFSNASKDADVRLFYYAGHGISVDGTNFMIPLGAKISTGDDVQWEAVDTSLVLNALEKFDSGANVIILDACRDNPLPRSTRSNRSGGLNKMEAPVGSLVLYATAPGDVALDGEGRNGTFTKHLLRSLAAPNVHLGDIALDVRVAVMQETNNQQVPWSESSLTRRIYLAGENRQVDTDKKDTITGLESTNSPNSNEKADLASSDATDTTDAAQVASADISEYEATILSAYMGAANAGDPLAQTRLGYIYDVGRSVPEDNAKARRWYEKAARQKQLDALVNLGVMYRSGDGVSVDREKAFSLFKEAADAGHPVAQRNLGTSYQFGGEVEVDYDIARMWFEKAAEKGYTNAYVDLGDLYSRGLGVQQDDSAAFNWYQKAALQGSADAQVEIGYYYDQGLGVQQAYPQALYWFEQAAAQGHAIGNYNLAEMHELGKGTVVDKDKAIQLYEKALLLGISDAGTALERLKPGE